MRRLIAIVTASLSFSHQLLAEASDIDAQEANNELIDEYLPNSSDDEEDDAQTIYAQATTGTTTPAPTTGAATTAPATDGTTPAATTTPAKKTKKKKKGAATGAAAEAPADATATPAVTGTGHGLQESGMPYKANVDTSIVYSSSNEARKFTDREFKTSTTDIAIALKYLAVLGPMEVGPIIGYQSITVKSTNASDANVNDNLKTGITSFGLGFAFNIGNISQDKMVPFVGMDVLRKSSKATATTDGSTGSVVDTVSTMALAIELGAKYFMGGHVALKPFFKYSKTLSGEDKSEVTGEEAQVASITGGGMNLGMGLVTYF